MKLRLAITLAATLAIWVGLVSAAGAAVTIGSNLTNSSPDETPCFSSFCTAVTLNAPASFHASGGLRAPTDGVVTSWRVRSGGGDPSPVNLRVLRPVAGLSFTGAGTSSTQNTVFGVSPSFATQLPIKAGDAIGIDNNGGGPLIFGVDPGPNLVYWTPPLGNGATAAGSSSVSHEVQVQATVEPDVDCDGKGDETQDTDLNDGPCADRAGPKQTLTAKKKQDVDKAAVNARLNEAGSVTIRGSVKGVAAARVARSELDLAARAVKTKKSTKSLVANKKTKIRIKLSSGTKRKVKSSIDDSGPRKIVVTVEATDSKGNSSSEKVSFKLTD